VLDSRDRLAPNRALAAFEGNEPPPPGFKLRGEGQAFDSWARAVARDAYQGNMVAAGFKNSPGVSELIEKNPKISEAIDFVIKEEATSRLGTSRAPESVVEMMHRVKRQIENIGLDASGRPTPTGYYRTQTADEFVKKLKEANPALAEADVAFAQAKSLPEFFDRGRDWLAKGPGDRAMNASAEGLDDLLRNANPEQVLATRSGATHAVRSTLETSNNVRRLAERIVQSQPMQAKLEQLYGPERAAEIIRMANAEMSFGKTQNEILRGSKSIDKAIEVFNGPLPEAPSFVPRWARMAWEAPNYLMQPNMAVRDEIGRTLLNPNAEENARRLARALAIMEARKRGAPVGVSLSGSAGGVASDFMR
jgi:hypothetical protein